MPARAAVARQTPRRGAAVARQTPRRRAATGHAAGEGAKWRAVAKAASGEKAGYAMAQQAGEDAGLLAEEQQGARKREGTTQRKVRKPEVLAPAGGWEQLRAAVEAGADAVYFGMTGLNARARAANFSEEDIPHVMAYLHERGLRGYVTLNILVFDSELPDIVRRAEVLTAARVDAVIVQDVGVAVLLRQAAPHLKVHASTQMSVTSAEGAEFARKLGAKRVVVGRELSVTEIARVSAGTELELEAFVHGALCVSYSGQCFSSEAWGGRSANRGQCAQACRMPYGLLVNGRLQELGDMKYLLSPQDLAGVDYVPSLMAAGVCCLKIEGRLKGPEYVHAVTRAYRTAVDAAWADVVARGEEAAEPSPASAQMAQQAVERGDEPSVLSEVEWENLRQVFARGQDGEHRGLTPGFLDGSRHQRLVRGRAPRHRGVFLGTITSATRRGIAVNLAAPVHPGDGIVIDDGRPENDEQGGAVYGVHALAPPDARVDGDDAAAWWRGTEVELAFEHGKLNLDAIAPGSLVWRTFDARLAKRLRAAMARDTRRVAVRLEVCLPSLGAPLTVRLIDEDGRIGEAVTAVVAEKASNRPTDATAIRKAIGELGDTPLAIRSEQLDVGEGLFFRISEVKNARRSAVRALLEARRRDADANAIVRASALDDMLRDAAGTPRSVDNSALSVPALSVLCRSREQAEAVLACGEPVSEIILDFLEVHGLREAVQGVKAAGVRCVAATPRVLKPAEDRIWAFYLSLGADALLIRSAGMLHCLRELGEPGAKVSLGGTDVMIPRLHGDFSLNAANVLAAHGLLSQDLDSLCLSHDVNADQTRAVAEALGVAADQLEVIIHTHLPIFHTEHCVFARFLSDGQNKTDCGHPCESVTSMHLRDGDGADHAVMADAGCRNTVFNASAQSGATFVADLVASGVMRYRVELVDEPASVVSGLVTAYGALLRGEISAGEVLSLAGDVPDANGNAQGVTAGSLAVFAERAWEELTPTAAEKRAAHGKPPPARL